jgi:anaerobic magnesium-protoporphyrin IX monomethyl ester cyclase
VQKRRFGRPTPPEPASVARSGSIEEAMAGEKVVLVAFLEQDNLGVGYVASVLQAAGFRPVIVDYRAGRDVILREVRRHQPLAVGFSIIFQYHIGEFSALLSWLRDSGVTCHFSAGGHYPSLRFRELMEMIPALDSVVLFEGEHTFLELVRALAGGAEWTRIQGIARRNFGAVTANPLRPLEPDLDVFPPPLRPPLREYVMGRKFATLLASRGCAYDCSFCSIRKFYSSPPGAVKRVRRPEMVVEEMRLLHEEQDCSIFMFQDDDFPVGTVRGTRWVQEFCRLLEKTGLGGRVLWKINCRPDEVDAAVMSRMRDVGLFLVYLGIESGTDNGLELMNKHMTAAVSRRAVRILKSLDIGFDFGFMLFDPSTSPQSLLENLDFLESICGDGSTSITFCKMLPYAGTRIERLLAEEGRLRGSAGREDYDFADSSVTAVYQFLTDCFADWIGTHDGLLNLSRWANYYIRVYQKYFPQTAAFEAWAGEVTDIIADSNLLFLETVRQAVVLFTGAARLRHSSAEPDALIEKIAAAHADYRVRLIRIIDQIESSADPSAARAMNTVA